MLTSNEFIESTLERELRCLCVRANHKGGLVDKARLDDDPRHSTNNSSAAHQQTGSAAGGRPLVVGATIVDMHVSTKVDADFKVSCEFEPEAGDSKLRDGRAAARVMSKAS